MQGVDVGGLEVVVDEDDVRQPLLGERDADVAQEGEQRLLLDVDVARPGGGEAGDAVVDVGQDRHLDLGVLAQRPRDPQAHRHRDDRVGRQRRVRAVRLGRADRQQQDRRSFRIQQRLHVGIGTGSGNGAM